MLDDDKLVFITSGEVAMRYVRIDHFRWGQVALPLGVAEARIA
jgi:hypothetical protein